MYPTLAAIGLAGLVLGMLFKVHVIIIASLAAAAFISGEAMIEGRSLLNAILHVLAGVSLLQGAYLFGAVFGERLGIHLWSGRSGRSPQQFSPTSRE